METLLTTIGIVLSLLSSLFGVILVALKLLDRASKISLAPTWRKSLRTSAPFVWSTMLFALTLWYTSSKARSEVVKSSKVASLVSQAYASEAIRNYDEAMHALRQADTLGADYAQVKSAIARVKLSQGDTSAAIEGYLMALNRDTSNVYALRALGMLYRRVGDYQRSIEYINRLIQVDTMYSVCHYEAGVTHTTMWKKKGFYDDDVQYRQAMSAFQKCIDLGSKETLFEAYFNIAVLYSLRLSSQQVIGDRVLKEAKIRNAIAALKLAYKAFPDRVASSSNDSKEFDAYVESDSDLETLRQTLEFQEWWEEFGFSRDNE